MLYTRKCVSSRVGGALRAVVVCNDALVAATAGCDALPAVVVARGGGGECRAAGGGALCAVVVRSAAKSAASVCSGTLPATVVGRGWGRGLEPCRRPSVRRRWRRAGAAGRRRRGSGRRSEPAWHRRCSHKLMHFHWRSPCRSGSDQLMPHPSESADAVSRVVNFSSRPGI